MRKTYRPGVYSQYDVVSRQKRYEGKYALFCGGAKVKEEKNLPAGGVVQLRSLQELNEYFVPEGAGEVFNAVCSILLSSGVSSVYVVPITIDGSVPTKQQYTAAIQKLCEIKCSGVILCDSTDADVLKVLCEKAQDASQNEREKIAVGGAAKQTAVQTAQSINHERMVLCAQAGTSAFSESSSVLFTAAALAGMLAVAEPDASFHGTRLELLTDIEALEEEEIEAFFGGGVTPLEENDTAVECIRCVTTRTKTNGETDRTFASVNVVMMIDDMIRSMRVQLSGLLKGSRAGISEDSVASQAAVVLDEKMQRGIITAFEPPVVYTQEDDPTVCVVELEFRLATVLSQIYLTAHISI